MWRDIASVGLAFGGIWLGATFAIPLAFAGGAVALWGKPQSQGLEWLMVAGCIISTIVLVPPYVQTVDRCRQLEYYQTPTVAELITGKSAPTAEDLEYVEKGCAKLPFA